MARTRRGRAKRMPVDWVVNDETYGQVYNTPNATQGSAALTLPGQFGYDVDSGLAIPIGKYQFPEQSDGQIVKAVRGQFYAVPSTWAVGSVYSLMVRLVVKPIEVDSGIPTIILDPAYTLFQPPYANERILWQRLIFNRFDLGTATEVHEVNWRGTVRLKSDEALWVIFENQSGITQTATWRFFLRTLMRAEA